MEKTPKTTKPNQTNKTPPPPPQNPVWMKSLPSWKNGSSKVNWKTTGKLQMSYRTKTLVCILRFKENFANKT